MSLNFKNVILYLKTDWEHCSKFKDDIVIIFNEELFFLISTIRPVKKLWREKHQFSDY